MEIIEAAGSLADLTKFEKAVDRMEGLETIPGVAQRLLSLTADPDAAFAEIEQLVSSDVALTARVLRVAASPLFCGQVPSNLRAAVVRLGLAEVRNLAVSAVMMAKAPDEFHRTLWEYSLANAVLADGLARRLGASRFRDPFVCGLLHDLGALVLAKMESALYPRLVGVLGSTEQVEREQAVLGFTHCDIGALAAQRWNLFDGLEQVIQFHHDPLPAELLDFPEPVLNTIRLVALTSTALRSPRSEADAAVIGQLLERLGATEEVLAEELERVPSQLGEYLNLA